MNVAHGANLLDRVVAFIRKYLVLAESEYIVIALWILHTYCLVAADQTPYLYLGSAEKRCGKTRALELLDLLIYKPWLTGRVTAAALVRKTANEHPTLLLDECDAAFRGPEEFSEALRGILNSGSRRGGKVTTCVGVGLNIKTWDFDVFCPKAIAGIGNLPDTVADRSIPIRLKRKSRSESVDRFRRRKVEPDAEPIRKQLAAWAEENCERVGKDPHLPGDLTDRQQDIVEPLLAIADCLGGDWSQRAREAVVKILTGSAAEDDSIGVRLLSDIREVFDAHKTEKMPSSELAEALAGIEGAPWSEYQRGQQLSPTKMAQLLKPFDIGPRSIRTANGTPKGYLHQDFLDAWSRYCRPSTDDGTAEAQQSPQGSIYPGETQNLEPPQGTRVADPKYQESSDNPPSVAHVAVVEPTGTKQTRTARRRGSSSRLERVTD